MDNIIVLHRDELSEIIHESVMNALRAFKEEENAPDSEFYTRKEVAAKWHVDEITVWRQDRQLRLQGAFPQQHSFIITRAYEYIRYL